MKYAVRAGGRVFEVVVDGGRVTMDGQRADAHLAAVVGTPLVHLLLSGESWTVAAEALDAGVAGGGGRWALGVGGERFEVEVVDERTGQIRALTGTKAVAHRGGTVRAPMPGLVVRIEVVEGQRVESGAGLVVVEAMKMENELRAPHAGRVQTVHVRVGEVVEKGAALVTLASPEPSS
ncbi:MAG: acetyl-CoA carboxylase biotin carboxyl carrier protein subunit [Gemmatimonadales bacterium]